MRNVECGIRFCFAKSNIKNSKFNIHSALRIPHSAFQKCGQLHFGLNKRQLSSTNMLAIMRKKATRHQLIFFI